MLTQATHFSALFRIGPVRDRDGRVVSLSCDLGMAILVGASREVGHRRA